MKGISVKLKITIWYTAIMTIISVAALITMTSVSSKMLSRDTTTRLENTVGRMAEEVKKSRAAEDIPGFKYYDRGVYMALFDSAYKVCGGQIPVDASGGMSFSDGNTRVEAYNGHEFYVTDVRTVKNGEIYWIKGFVPVSYEVYAVRAAARNNAVMTFFLILAAAVGGYAVIGKILTPIKTIRETADKISQSEDLSQRINIDGGEDELHKLAESFDGMIDKLERTLEREKRFTSDASHELRTPIAAILSSCEYMVTYADSAEDMRESASAIKTEAERMSRLISELLMISRMDANTLKADIERVDFGELLNFVCDEQAEIQSKKIELIRDIEENVVVEADRDMLARLAINLVSNAYSYGADGGRISVSLKNENEKAVLRVTDDGIGISEEDMPKIWERFYRADKSRHKNENGSMGLGLSIVKQIADFHAGSVSVESILGAGSTFTFEMPMRKYE